MEETILSVNPNLKKIFSESEKVHESVIISQISFARKSPIEDYVLMIGDAAGMITALCGNGMSMAFLISWINTKTMFFVKTKRNCYRYSAIKK